mgnify:CR=1 FL=1
MAGRFKMEKLPKYPHLKPEDVAVWERFLSANPDFFDSVDYDFRVGEGAPAPENLAENMAADLKVLTQKQIDVVGYKNDVVWIVELKPKADMRALGQVISYEILYKKQEGEQITTKKAVIAGGIENDLAGVYESNAIDVFIV